MPSYFITFETTAPDGGPRVGIFDGTREKPLDLTGALDHACQLISANYERVMIRDSAGNSIAGSALTACCRGAMRLTPDLRPLPVKRSPAVPGVAT